MLKNYIKRILAYRPLQSTVSVRNFINTHRTSDKPYCPDWEGDLMWMIIDRNRYTSCLETGFGTGSTALYMLSATKARSGYVTSIDFSGTNFNEIGKENLKLHPDSIRHRLIEEPSEYVLPKLVYERQSYDFVYVDGWKTFDHLAVEIFYLNRLLKVGGTIMFDDSRMNSVDKIIKLLKSHYLYEELDYESYNETWNLRIWHILTTTSLRRPYRAFTKSVELGNQPAVVDYRYFRNF